MKNKTNVGASSTRLQKGKNKPFDFILFIDVLILLGMGITMVLSASSPLALSTTSSSYTYVYKQAIAAVLGIIVMLIISKIDYKILLQAKKDSMEFLTNEDKSLNKLKEIMIKDIKDGQD